MEKSKLNVTHFFKSTKPLELAFENLRYSVHTKKDGLKEILHNISGNCHVGQVTALMGPSGAGKTTLLNVLSWRANQQLSGNIIIDGHNRRKAHKRFLGYVMQKDYFFSELTVNQTLNFTAKLKRGDLKPYEIKVLVDGVLAQLQLDTVRDVKVGDAFTPGISGGELKRLNIATELISNPSIFFLDEPTTGLDSSSAVSILDVVTQVANAFDINVVLSIHQPSSQAFSMLNRVILISDGYIVYQGPASELYYYLCFVGFKTPDGWNVSDYVMDLLYDYDSKTALQQKYHSYVQCDQRGTYSMTHRQHIVNSVSLVDVYNHNEANHNQQDTTINRQQHHNKVITTTTSSDNDEYVNQYTHKHDYSSNHDNYYVENNEHDSNNNHVQMKNFSGVEREIPYQDSNPQHAGTQPEVLPSTQSPISFINDTNHQTQNSTPTSPNSYNNNIYVSDYNEDGDQEEYLGEKSNNSNRKGKKGTEGAQSKTKRSSIKDSHYNIKSPPYLTIFWLLLVRGVIKNSTPSKFILDLIQAVVIAIIVGALWFQLFNDYVMTTFNDRIGCLFFLCTFWMFFHGFTVLSAFPSDRAVIAKERSSKTFPISAYMFSKTFTDVLNLFMFPTLWYIIIFFMIGMTSSVSNIIGIWFVIVVIACVAHSVGMFISSMIGGFLPSSVVLALYLLTTMLAGGLYIEYENLPIYLKWLRWISITSYGFSLVTYFNFENEIFSCGPDCYTSGAELRKAFSTGLPVWADFVCLFALLAFSKGMTYLFLRFGKLLKMG